MDYIILLLAIVFQASQAVLQKQVNVSTKGQNDTPVFLFNTAVTFTAASFFFVKGLISGCTFEFHLPTLFYAIALGVTYFSACTFYLLALRCGPLALTSLFLSYSLMIPTLYGIVFLDETVKWTSLIGFALLVVSLYLINMQKKTVKVTGKQRFNAKWLILVVLTFFANGLCSTAIKAHQVAFPGQYSDLFMTEGLAIAFLLCLTAFLIKNSKEKLKSAKAPIFYGIGSGLFNASMNTCDVYLTTRLPASLMYPVHSAGQIVLAFLASFFIFRERFTSRQYIGLAFGIASIVFLNL